MNFIKLKTSNHHWILDIGHWTLILAICIFLATKNYAADGIATDPSSSLYNARQMGLGGAVIGFSDDANGVFANPAELTNLEFPQMSGSSRKLVLDETQYMLFGWAMPTDFGTIGLGYTSTNTGASYATTRDPTTDRIMIDPSREATSFDNNVLALSYSRKIKDNLSIGLCYKLFNQSISGALSSKASASGIDLGTLFTPLPWLQIGANLQNLAEGTLKWDGGASDKIGGFYKIGCKINVLGASSEALRENPQPLNLGLDYDAPHSNLSSASYHLGLEYFLDKKTLLRSGLSPAGFSLGLGLINGGFRFDYAFSQNNNLPGETPHHFTLSYIGERVVSEENILKKKVSGVNFIYPGDKAIVNVDNITLTFEALARKVIDHKTLWTVTAVSQTFEVEEVSETELLAPVYLNGIKLPQTGTIETSSPLGLGRNVFQVMGFTSKEAISAEARVLRIEPLADLAMDYWAIRPIALSITLGLVKGYPDNTFKPENGISRAELVALLIRSLAINPDNLPQAAEFTDVPASLWSAKYVAYASANGIVTGYPDKTFKPNKTLTRAEGITIMARYAGLTEEAIGFVPFPDLPETFWANKYIAPAKQAGLLKYLAGKDFEPARTFTRAEACEVLSQIPRVAARIERFWQTGETSLESK